MENLEEIGYTESCAEGSKSTNKRVLEASTKEVVVAGLQQPQERHDTPVLELPWSRVEVIESSKHFINARGYLIDSAVVFRFTGHWEWGEILDCVIPRVYDEKNAAFSKLVSSEEVKNCCYADGEFEGPRP
ncbi:hypothetical protein ACFX2F_030840 [Malus domestica]